MNETTSFDFRPGLDGLNGKPESAPLVSSSSFPELLYHGFVPVAYDVPQASIADPANESIDDTVPAGAQVSANADLASDVPDRQAKIEALLDEVRQFEAAIKSGETSYTEHVRHLERLEKELNHRKTDRIASKQPEEYAGYLKKIREDYTAELKHLVEEQTPAPPVKEDGPQQGEPTGPPKPKPGPVAVPPQTASPSDFLKPATSSTAQGGMLGYGVLTTYRQDWKKLGVCLGRLISTICLAPGEVTRLAIIDWQRKSAGTSHEAIDQTDTAEEFSDQSRQIDEIKAGTASRIQEANSNNTQIGSNTTVSAGVSNPTWNAGLKSSLNVSHGVQASYASATSDLNASGSNRVDQITRELTQTQRSKRATIVKEVTQSEAERLSTRVVANYNQRHSLNLQYFEILQKYQITTQSETGKGCVFVPIQPLNFNAKAVRIAFAPQLFSMFQEDPTLAERTADLVQFLYGGETEQDDLIKGIQEAISSDETFITEHQEELDKLAGILNKLDDLRLKINTRSSLQETLATLKPVIASGDYRELIASLGSGHTVDYYTSAVLKLREKYEIASKDIVRAIDDRRLIFQARRRRLRNQQVSIQTIFAMNAGYFTQQIIMRLDPTELFRFLSAVSVTEAGSQSASSLADLGVQPVPVGYSGNMIAFLFKSPVEKASETISKVTQRLLGLPGNQSGSATETSVITLPTSGVFMEAVLGASMAAENTETEYKDWRHHEHTIPILPPDIDGLASRDRNQETFTLEEAGFGAQMHSMRQRALDSISSLTDFVSQLDARPSLPNQNTTAAPATEEPDDEPEATTKAPDGGEGEGKGDGDGDGDGIETID
ncbi:hypothetical protein [Marinobacter sp. KMM 10035]|uniref:hypothetical protein n=1 Tax=Marinobacter sp. KMM 10035 TaxID=3134034 RepID=UPI00397BBDAA